MAQVGRRSVAVCETGRVVSIAPTGAITHNALVGGAPAAVAVAKAAPDRIFIALAHGGVVALRIPQD